MAAERPTLQSTRKQRVSACRELACEYAFRPAAHVLVRGLAQTRTSPPMVVAAATASGLAAATLLWHRDFIAAAFLLQLKTILDNADGQLARATGRISAFGRYLDSESDLLINVALFVALGHVTGHAWLAVFSFCALTAVLSVDYNLERLFRLEQGKPVEQHETYAGATAVVARIYDWTYAPQDRVIEWFDRRRSRSVKPASLTVLANFGLSTQLVVLGICLVVGQPTAYLWVPLACLLVIPVLELNRGARRE